MVSLLFRYSADMRLIVRRSRPALQAQIAMRDDICRRAQITHTPDLHL
jgi:hypothetical protein